MNSDMEKFKLLVENAHVMPITEGYQDRVDQVVHAVMQVSLSRGMTKDALLDEIGLAAQRLNISDYRVSASAKKDFIKDVLEGLKGKIKIKRMGGATGPRAKTLAQAAIRHAAVILANDLMEEIGNVFPDGDPYDARETVIDKFVSACMRENASTNKYYFNNADLSLDDIMTDMGGESWQDMTDWVDDHVWPYVEAAFKKDHGVDVYGYMAQLWDQVVGDRKYDARTTAEHVKSQALAQGKSESEAQAAYDKVMDDFENSMWGGDNPYK